MLISLQYNSILDFFNNSDANCTSVGKIDNSKISFLKAKCPELSEKIDNRTIIMWKDRIEHIKKHTFDNSNLSIEEMCEIIPEILDKPDYLGFKPKDYSLQFIKRYKDNILVAVRIDSKGRLSFRTMFTITESQLSDYIRKGRAWKFNTENKNIDKQ